MLATNATTILIALMGLLVIYDAECKEYYYTRKRDDPNHLRISEEFKNEYVNEVKLESKINGTKYEYYKSSLTMSHDELVFETIDKIFRHRLSPFYIHHYDSKEDKERSFDPNIVSNEACSKDLTYLIDKLPKRTKDRHPYTNNDEDHLSPELTAFFDSYARQEPGLMMGNIYWVGAYEQCINRHIFELTGSHPHDDQHMVSFKGRYCVSALKSKTWDSIINARKLRSKSYFKSERQIENYSKLFRLQVGICLPDSCDSGAMDRHPDAIKLLTTSMLEQRFEDYELVDLYCLPDETSPLRTFSGSSMAFVVSVGTWFAILLTATLADLLGFGESPEPMRPIKSDASSGQTGVPANLADPAGPTKNTKPKRSKLKLLVTLLSIRANFNKIMKVNEETVDDGVNLRFLNAFKVLIMFWIVNGHIMLLMIQTAKNILYSDALLNTLMHFLIGATFGVDLFFTMTGFLTAYLIFNSGHAYKLRVTTWIYLSFHRYWRLAPMYLLTFWLSKSVMQLLGTGPLWDYGTSSVTFRGLCNHQSWWYPMTLTSNLHGLFDECMITSWYISCDMQFWLVSPIFIYLLAKNPKHGWAAVVSTIVMSSKLRYDSIMSDPSARYDELVKPRADIFMRVSHDLPALYTHPHYRISAYLVGLLAGHYVYMIKSGKWTSKLADTKDLSNLRNSVAYFGLLCFMVMAFVSGLLSHNFPFSLLKYAKSIAALAYAVDHLLMSIGASLIIITMCFGQWSNIVKFLSRPFWTRLSKMNYALLLLQCEAIYFQIFRYDQVPVAGTRELINILFNLLVTLYPAAFMATIAFEFPLANMEKLLM